MTPFPVSVKGVVVTVGRVLLLRNDRDEWELPGGRLELGETPEECVAREISEETGWHVETGPIVDSWVYEALPGRSVFIVTYGCHVTTAGDVTLSPEHEAAGLFAPADLADLSLPAGYRRSVMTWLAHGPS